MLPWNTWGTSIWKITQCLPDTFNWTFYIFIC
jgi:hypothetical protein